ncbi:MAG: glycosyltransferase family 2 protein [Candidatus Binatia bacterium]
MPQVSVVIPTFNRAHFLAAAVRSVMCQTFQDFELLIVDDGGSDLTPAIVESFRDERLRYIRHSAQRGGAAARNTGIVHSSGEYVAFLDDDDEWYPEKLARQMDLMLHAQAQVGGVYTGYLIVNRNSGSLCGQIIPRKTGKLYRSLLAGNCIGGTSSVLLRRACLERAGLFDEQLPSFQDYDLWIRIARLFEFESIAEPLLKYFVHGDQVWTNLDALTEGLEIMLRKHGSSRAFRKKSSSYYVSFGVRFCENNDLKSGRKAFLRAAVLYPYRFQPYLYACFALLGPSKFDKARNVKTKLLERFRNSHSVQNLSKSCLK